MTNIYITLAMVLFIIVGLILFSRIKRSWKRSYKPKGPSLLNTTEKRLFDTLVSIAGPEKYICPKVRLADIITTALDKTDVDYWSKLNSITQKHVDFVICDRDTFVPIAVVELDGGSHYETARIARDQLVDNAFNDAQIPIIHIPTSKLSDTSSIAAQLRLIK
ncbi:MAG: hypothetical protein RI947_1376 [Candidatus Parcubacteria bacterium]|jgi:hypothetical protein